MMFVHGPLAIWAGRRSHSAVGQVDQLHELLTSCERVLERLATADLLHARRVRLADWLDLGTGGRRDAETEITIDVPPGVSAAKVVLAQSQVRAGSIPSTIEFHGPGTILCAFVVDAELDDVVVVRGELGEVHRVSIETSCDAWMTHDLLGAPQPRVHECNASRLAAALRSLDIELQLGLEPLSSKRVRVGTDFTVDNLRFDDGTVYVPDFVDRLDGETSSLFLDYPNYVIGPRLYTGAGDEVRTGYVVSEPERRILISCTQGHPQPLDGLVESLALDVPGICGLWWHGEPPAEGIPYVDALVEALPLHSTPATATSGGCTEREWVDLGIAVAGTLAAAHERGWVVGGIRPETIYMDQTRCFAALAPRGPRFIATASQRAPGLRSYGTPYAGFEVLALGKSEGPAGDIFALCATLQHLATGRHPFGDEFPEILQRVVANAREPYPGSKELDAILARGMDPDPERRPTAHELAELLGALKL